MFFNKYITNNIRPAFFKKMLGITGVRVVGLLASLGISIFLGRVIGAEGLGIINLSNQIISIIVLLASFGLPAVILKEIAIAYSRQNWDHVNSVVYTCLRINLSSAILLALLLTIFIKFISTFIFNEPRLEVPLLILSWGLIFQVASNIYSSAINGLGKIVYSALGVNALNFVLIIITVLIYHFFIGRIDVDIVAIIYLIASFCVFLYLFLYWKSINKSTTTEKKFLPRPLLKVSIPLLVAGATNVFASSADTMMLGIFSTVEEVGYYSVAVRIAFFSTIILQITNSVIAPKIATLYANKNIDILEMMVQKLTLVLIIIGGFGFVILFFLGRNLLNIWGNEFGSAYWILIVLSVGQLVNIATGAVGLILSLCGQEKTWGSITIVAALVNVTLNYFLINHLGSLGAALSTAFTMIGINITGAIMVKRRLNILTLPFSLKGKIFPFNI